MTRQSVAPGSDDVLRRITECGLIAVLRSPTAADALRVGLVLLAAGFRVLEVTGTTPEPYRVLSVLRGEAEADVALGIGSIRCIDDVGRAVDVDADFLVSPGSPGPLVEAMLDTGRLALPGVSTATEVMHAEACGARAMKLFPANVLGTAGLRALLGPFPGAAFIPTGGIALEDISGWLDAGAVAVGVGGQLAPPSLPEPSESAALTAKVHDVLSTLAARRER